MSTKTAPMTTIPIVLIPFRSKRSLGLSLGLIILYFTGRIHLFTISLSEKQKIDRPGGIRAKKLLTKPPPFATINR